MKIFKDDTQSFMLRPIGIQDKLYGVVTVFIYFDLMNPDVPLKEQDLWATMPALLGSGDVLDQGMSKPRGEVIVKGSCFSPEGKPVRAMTVSLGVGTVRKTIAVFGERYWKKNTTGINTISEPLPFSEMMISWENAFGGEGYAKNPSGKGIETVLLKDRSMVVPLPNIEYPKQLVGSPSDRPEPAGFCPIDMLWPQRSKKQGTYDQKWLNERWPYFPADMNYEFFNVAPEDQFIEGFFSGGEPIQITHMHPDIPVINSYVPRFRMRCFVTKKTSLKMKKQAEEIFQEVTTKIDTVWLFPSVLRGVLVFRGSTEILDEEYADISSVFLSAERMDEPHKPIESYLEKQKKELDRTVPTLAASGIDDVKKKVEDALKRVRNLPKDIEEAKRKAMGKAPVLPYTPLETAEKAKSVISSNMALLEEMEGMILDMKTGLGPDLRFDMQEFDAIKKKLAETSAHVDNTMKEATKANRQGDELQKELSGIIRKNIPQEEIKKAGIDPDMLIDAEKVNPWHDRGFPLVVQWCKTLEKDTDTLDRLYGMGFSNRTIERAWMGINLEDYTENAELWGIGEECFSRGEYQELVIPAGLVLPSFSNATLTGICVQQEDFSKAGKEIFVKGSDKSPLFLPAVDKEMAPVVRTASRFEALYVEQEIGDACSVIVLDNPDDEPGKENIETIRRALAFVILLPELSSEEDLTAWQRKYPGAKILTLPKGNTVFEARQNGTDIRGFIMKNLPEDFAALHNTELNFSDSGGVPEKSPAGSLVIPAFDAAAMVDQFSGDLKAFLKPQVDEATAYEKEIKAKARNELIKAGKDPAEVALSEEELSKKTISRVGEDTVKEINRVKERLRSQGVLTLEYEQKMNEMAERADRMSKTAENMYAEGMKKLEDAKDKIEKARAGELPDEVRQQLKEAGIDPDKVKKLGREEVIERYEKGERLSGTILNGADLSNLDLHGVDLSEAQCQKTNFSGTNLNKAVFVQTVATEADFTGASLMGAFIERALFPKAIFKKARMTDAHIDSTVLQEVDLTETDLSRANFKMSIIQKSKLEKTVLIDVYLDMTVFDESDANHAIFTGAHFVKCLFQKMLLDNADFSASVLDSTMLFGCKGKDVKFIGAELKKGRIAGRSIFSGANFRQIKMIRGCLRESDFSNADLQRSMLDFSMIESCDLRGAKFAASSAKHVRFTRSDLEAADMRGVNLFQGSLRKTRLVNTDFRGASLFGVDFYKTIMGNTNLEKVNLKRTFLERREGLLK